MIYLRFFFSGIASIDFCYVEDFEAQSGNGKIAVMISNIGEISAEFDLTFNCTKYI